jgi:hypothetical protein
LACDHYKVRQGSDIQFKTGKHQQSGTIRQPEHSGTSKKNRSRSANNVVANISSEVDVAKETQLPPVTSGRKPFQKNKSTSVRPASLDCACNFAFKLLCSGTATKDGKWYILSNKGIQKNARSCGSHSNHLPVEAAHITTKKRDLSPTVIERVYQLISSGSGTTSIVNHVCTEFQIVVSHQQIQALKIKHVDELILASGEDPSGSAAERLIQIYKHDDNVTYIYVKHRIDSGFVTYRKDRNSQSEVMKVMDPSSENGATVTEIESWRNDLCLGGNNEILVSFAWSHIEESRKLCMFPEFVACDLTFGVNRQRRPLFVMSGVDGHKRTFTGMRCLMPSKTKKAYVWVFDVALTFLIGTNAVNAMQCISTDNEEALLSAIEQSKQLSSGLPKHLKHRLDFYHLFIQPWRQLCIPKNTVSQECRDALQSIYCWVYTWVHNVESNAEFEDSLQKYEKYFLSVKVHLQEHLIINVETVVGRVLANMNHVGNHMFMRTVTFGYVGSSIVEGTNVGIKKGPHAAKATMNLDTSGVHHLSQVENFSQRRNVEMARNIARFKHWSSSNTKQTLTGYHEGLAVKYFDSTEHYVSVCCDATQWLVYRKGILDECGETPIENHIPTYERIRQVTLDADGFMKCTCSHMFRYLSPCVHAMTVLESDEYIVPDLFHIRWWEVFNYYYLTKFGIENLPDLQKSIENVLFDTTTLGFDTEGAYRGCNLKTCGFLEKKIVATDYNSDNYKTAIAILRYTTNVRPIEKGSQEYVHFLFENGANDQNFEASNESFNEDTTHIGGIGGLSQCVTNVSPQRLLRSYEMNRNTTMIVNDTENYHLAMRVIDAAKTLEQKNEMRSMFHEMENRFLKANRKDVIGCDETTFLGEDGSAGPRSGKRHKQAYEKYL